MFARPIAALSAAAMTATLAFAGVVFAEENGLHQQPWFAATFLDMSEDLADATADGKDLMILVEQTGCVYCQKMHEVNFSRDDIPAYIQEHFLVVQMDMAGTREVTDFDGQTLLERDLMRKWGVRFTPTTLMFATPEGTGDGPLDIEKALAMALPGYLKPESHLATLQYVARDGYVNGTSFADWMKSDQVAASN